MTHDLTLVSLAISHGQPMLYRFTGRMAGVVCRDLPLWSRRDPDSAQSTAQSGTRTCEYRRSSNGSSARARFSLSEPTETGGKWKWESSSAGGPWTVFAEGEYTKSPWSACRDFGEVTESV